MCSALGYKSDGHFHYDWNYLLNASMIEEKQGFFLVTDTGKKEFALYSTASMNNLIMVVMGLAMVFFTVAIQLGFLPPWSVASFGITLVALGSLFLMLGRRNKPKLPPEAKALLKELRHSLNVQTFATGAERLKANLNDPFLWLLAQSPLSKRSLWCYLSFSGVAVLSS